MMRETAPLFYRYFRRVHPGALLATPACGETAVCRNRTSRDGRVTESCALCSPTPPHTVHRNFLHALSTASVHSLPHTAHACTPHGISVHSLPLTVASCALTVCVAAAGAASRRTPAERASSTQSPRGGRSGLLHTAHPTLSPHPQHHLVHSCDGRQRAHCVTAYNMVQVGPGGVGRHSHGGHDLWLLGMAARQPAVRRRRAARRYAHAPPARAAGGGGAAAQGEARAQVAAGRAAAGDGRRPRRRMPPRDALAVQGGGEPMVSWRGRRSSIAGAFSMVYAG